MEGDPTSSLRGLSIRELETLINLCIAEGARSTDYITDAGKIGMEVWWAHEIMGIPVRFRYFKSKPMCSFRIEGRASEGSAPAWAVSFKGLQGRLTNTTFVGRLSPYKELVDQIHIGPLDRDAEMRIAPTDRTYSVGQFRRRGSLQRYRHDFSILRLALF